VAVESQRKNKAITMRLSEILLPRMLSLLSCIPFVPGVSLDAVGSLDRNGNLYERRKSVFSKNESAFRNLLPLLARTGDQLKSWDTAT
jgi:hypothetical protein